MADFAVRRLTGADAAAWQALRLEALSLYPGAFLTTHAEAAAKPLEAVAEQLEAGHTFGVFEGDDVIGIGSLIRHTRRMQTRHRADLGAFYVQRQAQGRGAARTLMAGIVAQAKTLGVLQLELFVAASNARAIAFYQREGFQEFGRIPNATLADGYAETDLILIRDLS